MSVIEKSLIQWNKDLNNLILNSNWDRKISSMQQQGKSELKINDIFFEFHSSMYETTITIP